MSILEVKISYKIIFSIKKKNTLHSLGNFVIIVSISVSLVA